MIGKKWLIILVLVSCTTAGIVATYCPHSPLAHQDYCVTTKLHFQGRGEPTRSWRGAVIVEPSRNGATEMPCGLRTGDILLLFLVILFDASAVPIAVILAAYVMHRRNEWSSRDWSVVTTSESDITANSTTTIHWPPGARIRRVVRWLPISKRTLNEIVDQPIADMREEYYEAVTARNAVEAKLIVVRGNVSVVLALVRHLLAKIDPWRRLAGR